MTIIINYCTSITNIIIIMMIIIIIIKYDYYITYETFNNTVGIGISEYEPLNFADQRKKTINVPIPDFMMSATGQG